MARSGYRGPQKYIQMQPPVEEVIVDKEEREEKMVKDIPHVKDIVEKEEEIQAHIFRLELVRAELRWLRAKLHLAIVQESIQFWDRGDRDKALETFSQVHPTPYWEEEN